MDWTQVKKTYEVFFKLQFVMLKKDIKGINNYIHFCNETILSPVWYVV